MTRFIRVTALTAALLIGTAVTAGAQGGGMRQAPDAMALLERPLAGIDGLTDAQKDTLN